MRRLARTCAKSAGRRALLGALVLLAGCDAEAPALAGGAFVVDDPTVDFGRVFEGRILEHEWTLEVRAPVAVEAAKTDCGCTLAELACAGPDGRVAYAFGSPLAVGDTLYVLGRYDTRGRRGSAPRSVTLTTSAGGILALTLAADLVPWLEAVPSAFPFTRVLEGGTAERTFEVRSSTGEPFLLTATRRAIPPWVAVELAPRAPDAGGRSSIWDGVVRLGAEAPRGTFSYPIELESDVAVPGSTAGDDRRFGVSPAFGVQVVGPVALSRPNLEFGLVRADETVARTVLLESFDPGFVPDAPAAHLEPLRAADPFPLGRTATVRTRRVGEASEIEVTLAGLDPEVQGNFFAKLVVETGHPALPRLEALVRGVRAP